MFLPAARGSCRRLFAIAAVAVITLGGGARSARAGEPADRGLSLSAAVGGALDRSVTAVDSGRRLNETAPVIGATGVGNIERFAIGGAVDTTPGALGNGRLSLGALLGYQQQVRGTRFTVLAEAGGHRFSDVGGTAFGRQMGQDTWLPFGGLRLGAARTVPAHGFVEVGAALFARADLEQTTVTHFSSVFDTETQTDYRLGGFMAGLTLQAGLRLEAPHPWNQGVAEE
jgi:hypothetical protein